MGLNKIHGASEENESISCPATITKNRIVIGGFEIHGCADMLGLIILINIANQTNPPPRRSLAHRARIREKNLGPFLFSIGIVCHNDVESYITEEVTRSSEEISRFCASDELDAVIFALA